jgi:hypothetical protein
MADDEPTELTDEEAQRRQLRLLGTGTAVCGLVTILVAAVSTRPYGILVFGFGAIGVMTLVFERTQGARVGLSLGFLTASVIVWLWPILGEGSSDFTFLGVMLVLIGLLNIVATPIALYFRRLGERLGERTQQK